MNFLKQTTLMTSFLVCSTNYFLLCSRPEGVGMKLCWFGWHHWKNWTVTPVGVEGDSRWYGGQARQCLDCQMIEVQRFGRGIFLNLRPLRESVRKHVEDLERCAVFIRDHAFTSDFEATASEIELAASELTEALKKDEGIF